MKRSDNRPKSAIKYHIAVLLLRIMTGAVFLSEGIQKFLFPDERGTGRFIKIGLPQPEFLGTAVPLLEILCGVLLLIGLFTRMAVIPLLVIMIAAIISTKIPILMNEGFWELAHAARTDWSMLLASAALIITGAGRYSLDRLIKKK